METFIGKAVVLAIHGEQLAEHGGAPGVRDEGALESALNRPENQLAYGDPPPDMADLAAAYAFGIARNHPFVDGNKRTSLVVAETYLALNGATLEADDAEVVAFWLEIAAGEVEEEAIAEWLRERLTYEVTPPRP